MWGGGGNTNNYTQQIRDDEAARQERVRTGTKRIEDMFGDQFDDAFYDKQAQSYLDFANPQLDDQFKNAAKQLTYSLDRRGALDSTSRSSLEADLGKRKALLSTEIKDKANQFKTDAMAGVEGARSDLINTLNATGDVDATVNSANARAKVLSQPVAYSPIAQAFSDFTTALGQQAAAEKAFAYGAGPRPAVSTGLFGSRPGAVVNT
ncbi:hypothetical protein [Devosia marina]|uniref:Uncharacterized protein n=1 Tax=Devosia marina TaxID=2683198 RepID=A0A7X3FNL2_9HYPH|nr:hypothetical protein [Devosia marina]MVS97889.1 hypothetical protein [Devosia marina]